MTGWIKKHKDSIYIVCGATAGSSVSSQFDTARWYEYCLIFTVAWIVAYILCYCTIKLITKQTAP